MTTRRSRAADTQRIAADYARTHGWPYAQANGSGAPGRDLLGMPGLAIRVLNFDEEADDETAS